MADAGSSTSNETTKPRLGPRSKIVIPEVFTKSGSNGRTTSVAPASERSSQTQDRGLPPAADEPAVVAEVAAAAPAPSEGAVFSPKPESFRPAFAPISSGLSSVKLPLGPPPKDQSAPAEEKSEENEEEKEKPPQEAKVGDLVEFFMGRGQVRAIREGDGILEVWAMGWEMAGEQRPRYFVSRDAIKVVPTVYYKMPVLERLQIAAWLKDEGTKLFKAGNYEKAAENYMKSIGVLKTCEFKSNAQNARALELMIPCHNNAANCYIKRKNYGDARVVSENVDTLCSALERNRSGAVMKALKERGVGETTILGQWWCRGLFFGGKACLLQGEDEEAVNYLRKGSKLAKPAALATLRRDINNLLEKATKRLATQTKKAQKMWTKAFSKNSTDASPEESVSSAPAAARRGLPAVPLQPTAVNMNGASVPQRSVLERLEELTKMRGISATPVATKSGKQENHEEEDQEEESEEEYDDDDDDGDDQSLSLASSGLLWGSIARNYAAATAPRPEYRWCGVEQVDEAAPIPTRSNGWRYLGPREGGETYRRQAVFGVGFRLHLPFPRLSSGPGHRWFNSHPLGGNPDLPDFQAWARTMLRRRLMHRDDADAWRAPEERICMQLECS
eukprot:g19941.t1